MFSFVWRIDVSTAVLFINQKFNKQGHFSSLRFFFAYFIFIHTGHSYYVFMFQSRERRHLKWEEKNSSRDNGNLERCVLSMSPMFADASIHIYL